MSKLRRLLWGSVSSFSILANSLMPFSPARAAVSPGDDQSLTDTQSADALIVSPLSVSLSEDIDRVVANLTGRANEVQVAQTSQIQVTDFLQLTQIFRLNPNLDNQSPVVTDFLILNNIPLNNLPVDWMQQFDFQACAFGVANSVAVGPYGTSSLSFNSAAC